MAASPYVSRVFEFVPAPGQFVNLLPAYDSADNAEAMLAKVNDCLVGKANGTVLTLGAWGGYVVVGFDHTIANVADAYDFQINGNAFANNAEPGVVMVSVDENGNDFRYKSLNCRMLSIRKWLILKTITVIL